MNFAGVEELDVRRKIRPRVGATLVKPKQTDAAIITPEDTSNGASASASPVLQAKEGENMDMKKLHHLMHAGRPPLFQSSPMTETHNAFPLFCRQLSQKSTQTRATAARKVLASLS